ncbi:MAG: hypothetical protein JKY52_10850 [Flavobacteriales bacterium]|nr:hypothetical protein [Flavobacteriales bacterium]
MKTLIISILSVVMLSLNTMAQDSKVKDGKVKKADSKVIKQEVEASCGQCQFGLSGDGCHLAVRIDGKAYLVDGTNINEHGDAHAEDGFCNAIRKAKVEGKVKGGKFKAAKFELLEDEKKVE